MTPDAKSRIWPLLAVAIALFVAVAVVRSDLPRRLGRGGGLAEASQVKPAAQDHASGPYLFRTFCASCHGSGGRGDGPVADTLRQRPPDLTTITRRRGGAFPRAEMVAAIDGRRAVAGHGNSEMPVWGDVLRSTEGQDDAIIRRRIDALVMHIESLQVK